LRTRPLDSYGVRGAQPFRPISQQSAPLGITADQIRKSSRSARNCRPAVDDSSGANLHALCGRIARRIGGLAEQRATTMNYAWCELCTGCHDSCTRRPRGNARGCSKISGNSEARECLVALAPNAAPGAVQRLDRGAFRRYGDRGMWVTAGKMGLATHEES
jgi:hypothetical protein